MTGVTRYAPRLNEVLANAAKSFHAYDEAKTLHWLEEAVRLAPCRTDVRFTLAGYQILCNMPEAALTQYEEVLALLPDNVDALFLSAHWRRFMKDDATVGERVSRLASYRPDRAEALRRIWGRIDKWERLPISDAVPDLSGQPVKPCVLILGLLLNDDGSPKPGLIARLEKGLEAFNRYSGAMTIVSGGMPRSGRVEAVVMREWLRQKGMPDERIFEEGYSRNIVENLIFSRDIMMREGVDAVVAVTCAKNIRRTGSGLDIVSDNSGLKWETAAAASAGPTLDSFTDDGGDRLRIYRDALRSFGIPMLTAYPFMAER